MDTKGLGCGQRSETDGNRSGLLCGLDGETQGHVPALGPGAGGETWRREEQCLAQRPSSQQTSTCAPPRGLNHPPPQSPGPPILPFHARWVSLSRVKGWFLFLFEPPGMGQESTLWSPKGWGRDGHEWKPSLARISSPSSWQAWSSGNRAQASVNAWQTSYQEHSCPSDIFPALSPLGTDSWF